MGETLVVSGIVVVAAVYLGFRMVRQLRTKKSPGCGCGTDSCPAASSSGARRH